MGGSYGSGEAAGEQVGKGWGVGVAPQQPQSSAWAHLTEPMRLRATTGAPKAALAGAWEAWVKGSALFLQLGRLWARAGLCAIEYSWGECVLCKSAKFTWLVRAKAASGAPAQWEEYAVDVKEDVQRGGRGCAGLWRRAGGWQCTPGCSSLWAGTGWCGSVRRARVLPREIWGCPPATGPGSERHALRWRAALAAPAPGAPPQ